MKFWRVLFENKGKITGAITATLSILAAANMLDAVLVVKLTALTGALNVWWAVWADIVQAKEKAITAVTVAVVEEKLIAAERTANAGCPSCGAQSAPLS